MRKPALRFTQFVRVLLCGGMLLGLAASCAAQRYSFREYRAGLANLNITGIAQDRTGFLWAGTENGLYRYDGVQFLRFGVDRGLTGRMIQNLFVGPDGTLWVGTGRGIFFERKDGNFEEVKPPGGNGHFSVRSGTSFAARSTDAVVAATRRGAILLRRAANDHWTAESMRLESNHIFSVLYASDGTLWFGCDYDLCRMADGKTEHMGAILNLPSEQWIHLLQAADGHLWIRGLRHLGEVDPTTRRFALHDLPGTSSARPDQALAQDAKGRIVASQGDSFGFWDNGRWRMVTSRNGLAHVDISQLFTDREGSLWIGLVGHGLLLWLGEDSWESYVAADGLSDDTVWAMTRDETGRLWIGTDSGLNYLPAGEHSPQTWRQAGIASTRAVALETSADGAVWMGSAAGAIVRIDPRNLHATQWKLPEVYRLLTENPHRLWIATVEGLYQLDPLARNKTPIRVLSPAFRKGNERFSNLCLGPDGTVWATADGQLYRLDNKGWAWIDPAGTGMSPDQIAFDHSGNLWTASSSQDLMEVRIRGDRVVDSRHIGEPPLLSQQVVALMVDRRGWLWVGQDAGLSVFDGRRWRNYTQADGLIWNDVDGDALMEDRDDSIWIGTSGGISHLMHPTVSTAGGQKAPVFSGVTYGNRPLKDNARESWQNDSLTISMASLTFRDTQDMGIRYRLVGGEGSDWETAHEMTVHYRHLVPGDYRFEAMAVDASGAPLSPVATFQFHIRERWWQSVLVQFLLILLTAVVACLAWRWRVGRLLVQKRQLESAVQMRTEDLVKEKAELVRTREQMRHYAEHDDLTGLWNHRIIVERLQCEVERSCREGMPLSVILVDLDHFKRINDTHGHPAGDEVLRSAGVIFQQMVRNYDWVGRYGGEEFLLILPGSSYGSARLRAEELRVALETARIGDGTEKIPVTASFGVASGYAAGYEELIHAADQALYGAKHRGRNCVESVELEPRGTLAYQ
ncbi:MAG: diguanylate cyclase [Terracidiphilus sp.]